MNKKGYYVPMLIIFLVFLLGYAFSALYTKDIAYAKVAGQNQIKLIEKYQEGEFIRLYIKQSARNSINNALYEFGQNGALKEEKCKKDNYFLWNKDCKPNKDSFLFYFDKNFKSFLKFKKIPDLNFDNEIENNKLIAKSRDYILFNLNEDKIELKKQILIPFSIDKTTGYNHHIKEASQRFNVDENLIRAVIKRESDSIPTAVSPKGAVGLMQIMEGAYIDVKRAFNVPWTFEQAKFDPRLNILTGTAYLKLQLDEFKDVSLALAAYNAGPRRVREYKGIPPFKETQDYVKIVTSDYNKLKVASIEPPITGGAVIDTKKEAILTGTYERDPSFIEEINFDFNILDNIYEEVKNSKDCLKTSDITSNLINCIKDKKGFQWNLNKEGNFINFEIITNFKILRDVNNKLIQENLFIKFKADLENL